MLQMKCHCSSGASSTQHHTKSPLHFRRWDLDLCLHTDSPQLNVQCIKALAPLHCDPWVRAMRLPDTLSKWLTVARDATHSYVQTASSWLEAHVLPGKPEACNALVLIACTALSAYCCHLLIQKIVFQYKCNKLAKTVPGVRGGLPILGQAIKLISTSPWDLLTSWVAIYGPFYQFNLFGTQVLVAADPDYMKELMRTKERSFNKDLVFAYKPFMPLFGGGIVTSDGQKWFHQRRTISSLLRIDILQEIPDMAKQATERLSVKLDKAAKLGEAIDISEEFRHLTLQVISDVLLSLSPQESDENFAHMYLPIVIECHKRIWNPLRSWCIFMPAFWKFQKNISALNKYISAIIKERWELRQAEEKQNANGSSSNGTTYKIGTKHRRMDILDKLLDSVEDSNDTTNSNSSSSNTSSWNEAAVIQIRDEMKTMVLAGHETSASMLNWALIELVQSKNKECMTHAVSDADNAWRKDISSNDSTDTAATDTDSEQQQQLQQQPLLDLSALDYTEACLREALRKYSIVPIVSRLCIRDVVIDGPNGIHHHVPKGTIVMMLTQGVHHRDDIWPKSADYIPERFATAKPQPFTFLPFIDGPRNCLGQNLSLLESKVVLSMLLRKYEFEFADGLSETDACRKHKWLIPVIPHHDTMVTVKKRVVLS
eukprot:13830-Heterococcus_DN1.PRE.4